MKNRIEWIDAMSGVMILWMVLYHIFIFTGNKYSSACVGLYKFFYFFMPWFFYKSGMLAKQIPVEKCFYQVYKDFLIPYLIFSFLGYLVYLVCLLMTESITFDNIIIQPIYTLFYTGSILGNLPLWFLLALGVDKIIWQLILRFKVNKCVVAISSFILCFSDQFIDLPIPYYVWFTFSGLYFYSIGSIFKEIKKKKGVFSIAIILYSLSILWYPNSVQMRSNTIEFGYYIFWPITSLSAIIVWNNSLDYSYKRLIYKYSSSRTVWGGVKMAGEYSMPIYVCHALVLSPVSVLVGLASYRLSPSQQFWVVLCLCILIIPFATKGSQYILKKASLFFSKEYKPRLQTK